MAARTCKQIKDDGQPCGAAPLHDDDFCFWHSPKYAEEAAEARRQGGLRRRRESVVAGVYNFEGLHGVEQIQRLLEIATVDTLALESSIARSRAIAYLAGVALKAHETGELEGRLKALEAALGPRLKKDKVTDSRKGRPWGRR